MTFQRCISAVPILTDTGPVSSKPPKPQLPASSTVLFSILGVKPKPAVTFPCLQEGWDFVPQTYTGTWSVFLRTDHFDHLRETSLNSHPLKKKRITGKAKKEQDTKDLFSIQAYIVTDDQKASR